MTQDKNVFDEQLEIEACREARKHDDHCLIQVIAVGMLLLVVASVAAVMVR